MEKISYPVLIYKITDEAYLGVLVGAGYQVMERDVRRVKDSLSDFLKRDYKKNGDYPFFEISEAKMKMIGVNIRPTYSMPTGAIFPVSKEVRVEMPIIYGETEKGIYQCHLPLFGGSFYYYDQRQLKVLAQHFITVQLNERQPEAVYRFLGYGTPELETISLKVNYNRVQGWGGIGGQRRFDNLEKLTERLPLPKSMQRRMSALPQTAWELEDKVTELTEKLISQKANVLIVGKRGTGKSAILQQAIRKITPAGKRMDKGKTFWRMMPQRLTASAKWSRDERSGLFTDIYSIG